MKSDEQKLREYFQALRSEDFSAAPSFRRLSHVPAKDRRRKTTDWSLSSLWIPIGATAAIAAVLVLSLGRPQTSAPGLTTEYHLKAMCDWNPSTDTLLASGTELWDSYSVTDELIDTETADSENRVSSRESSL